MNLSDWQWWYIPIAVIAIWIGSGIKIADQWNRVIILRLGRFARVSGPGLFIRLPVIEKIAQWVNVRIRVTQIQAEAAMTKDTVPVTVKTVMFWRVVNPRDAVIEVDSYQQSLELAAQTALRTAIGTHDFTDLLCKRESVDEAIKESIEAKAEQWGLEVQSIEIQDVQIPDELQDAMSREAQAERENHARVILGESEISIANKFKEAASIYASDDVALQLRAMNIIYETTKERGATVLLPTQLVDALSIRTTSRVNNGRSEEIDPRKYEATNRTLD
jgi:regulator of protease activity HflC (stomatin/prohibitin superfamily)